MLIDTHAHIDFPDYENLDYIIKNANDNGIEKIIIPGVEQSGFERIITLIEKYDCLYGALGIHPSEAKSYNQETEKQLLELGQHKKIVAIGEIGLDYYWDKTFIEEQKEVFIKQIEIAKKLAKPIIVHEREAHLDCFEIMEKQNAQSVGVVMHCFSGSPEFAMQCAKKGYYIGVGGVVTFKNAKKLKEAVKVLPLENIVLETDSPYLAPQKHRGERNEPAYIRIIAEEVADLKGLSFEETAQTTTQNAVRLFKLKKGI